MKDLNTVVPTVTPEIFTRVRGEILEAKGDVSLFRAAGEEVPAIKGAKLYLNDTIISREDSAVIANFGDAGVLVLGQNQQVPLYSDFFQRVDSLEQAGTADTSTLSDGAI
ncbi:MAG: hypothetical protein ACJATQ_001334, partial [Cellvibrionaceae bacterium]